MRVHEYQAHKLLAEAGIPVPAGGVARTAAEAADAFAALGGPAAVVKAQILAGGRGKAGGVKLVRSADEAAEAAERMFDRPMVTAQTGPDGVPVRAVMVAQAVEIAGEFYVAVTIDRARKQAVLLASGAGGVDIEQVARECPDAMHKEFLHPLVGLQPHQARRAAGAIGLDGELLSRAAKLMASLGRVFLDKDCSLAEINPLAVTADGQLAAIDAKIAFDDNALFRHSDAAGMFDESDEPAVERRARKAGLSYVAMGGDIGCVVNGAGLAMATMDLIKLHGGTPANFLDVGGGVSPQQAAEAFRILLDDGRVKSVLVNIFGGIARCDLIAEALIQAGSEIGFKVPVVVRLEGTNARQARELLVKASGQGGALVTAVGLEDAAAQAVDLAKGECRT